MYLSRVLSTLGVVLPLWAGTASADTTYKICNKGTATTNVFVVRNNSIFGGTEYSLDGWYSIAPSDCETVYYGGAAFTSYLGFMRLWGEGGIGYDIVHVSSTRTLHQETVHIPICVDFNGAMHRTGTLSVLGQCPDRWIKTEATIAFGQGLFPQDLDFTLELGRDKTDRPDVMVVPSADQRSEGEAANYLPPGLPVFGSKPEEYQLSSGKPLPSGLRSAVLLQNEGSDKISGEVRGKIANSLLLEQWDIPLSCDTPSKFTIEKNAVSLTGKAANFLSIDMDVRRDGMAETTHSTASLALAKIDYSSVKASKVGNCWVVEIQCLYGGNCIVASQTDGAIHSLYMFTRGEKEATAIASVFRAIEH